MRALAITMVFVSHGITALSFMGVGVDLFFVLSGFLIGRIYFRAHQSSSFSLLRFWESRWWRTLPPYFVTLGVAYLLSKSRFGFSHPTPWYYLFFLQNYLGIEGLGITWSLCVEEHFYLLLPLLGGLLLRVAGKKNLLWILLLLAIVPQCFRTWTLLHGGFPVNWYWFTHYHCEGLVLGVLLAYLFLERPDLWQKIRPLALVLSLIPIVLVTTLKIHPDGSMKLQGGLFLYYALGFASWIRVAYDLQWNPRTAFSQLVKRTIHGLALCSYSIYLLHTLLLTDIRALIQGWPQGVFKSTFILGSTLLLSVLFYFAVERPTILLRDRYLNRESKRLQKPA